MTLRVSETTAMDDSEVRQESPVGPLGDLREESRRLLKPSVSS